MDCPNCKSALRTIQYEGLDIETCDGCGGEWLDADELGKIVRLREVKFDEQERRAIAESTSITGVRLEEVDRDLLCPKCGAMLREVAAKVDREDDVEISQLPKVAPFINAAINGILDLAG